ncbi:ATP-binding cassette domain-containing protein [Luteolibacter pohnpeiensis]|uniref:ATP-binding cassette domain-containing protein n=1 Tax=Luteolibacter pohnpeiensis TaxID=454153 RepID=A0A934VUJ7_9BACT|nr:ATP-binding cassette domain-containing protein [Luteolibacter pohnpeiensis]MBK1882607.1 ATP-binding cassette domain-containing protein [Luteolibacter pohnpeiensis]
MTSPCIHLKSGLEIGYGKPIAKLSESIQLSSGTHFLLARNGRGKTTLLRTIARTLKARAGEFETQGYMQYLPEDLRFDPEITPGMIFRMLISKDKRSAAMELAKRIELDVKKPYGRLSTGNRRKTSLIMAEFSIRPNVGNILLLDEPFSGLDAFARQIFEDMWKQSSDQVLRLVSCHPDYDSMQMPSAVLIERQDVRHISDTDQTWSSLKTMLN